MAEINQIGIDINGASLDDQFGTSVSLSADGKVLAIGAENSNSSKGLVSIYKNDNGAWVQIGETIHGQHDWAYFGDALSLSSDGSILAIGSHGYDTERVGGGGGRVQIYKNIDDVWTQVGQNLDGQVRDYFGKSVNVSSDGSIIAIGAMQYHSKRGYVQIYKNVDDVWTQVGSDIQGESIGDYFGYAMELSDDGSVIAIGGDGNDANGSDSGHVRIYKNIDNTWTQVGGDIDGEAAGDGSGRISLSRDGNVVAIGAANNDGNGTDSGHVRVYKNVNDVWTQIGSDLDGEAAGDFLKQVSLSRDGSVLAIGAGYNDGNGTDSGHVRIYKNVNDTWVQVGSSVNGEASNDWLGDAISLSADGTVVAIGSPGNDGNGSNSGQVQVFSIDLPPSITGPSGSAGDSTSTKSINENITAIHTFSANETVTWSLNGGDDASKFSINSSTGALSFTSAPDYESPTDSNSGNDYVVVVKATDSAGNTSDQTLTISVADVDEVAPSIFFGKILSYSNSLIATTLNNNAKGAVLNSNIFLTFSEAVDVETGIITIKKTSDNSTLETIDVTSDQVTGSGTTYITINPSTDFESGTEYYVQIDDTAFDDSSGNSYPGISDQTAFTFTTIYIHAPKLLSAETNDIGTSITLSYHGIVNPIIVPLISDYEISINGGESYNPDSIAIGDELSTVILDTSSNPISNGNNVNLSYSGHQLYQRNGSLLVGFLVDASGYYRALNMKTLSNLFANGLEMPWTYYSAEILIHSDSINLSTSQRNEARDRFMYTSESKIDPNGEQYVSQITRWNEDGDRETIDNPSEKDYNSWGWDLLTDSKTGKKILPKYGEYTFKPGKELDFEKKEEIHIEFAFGFGLNNTVYTYANEKISRPIYSLSTPLGNLAASRFTNERIVNKVKDIIPPLIDGDPDRDSVTRFINKNTTAIHTFLADETVTWSLNGGDDAAKFSIDSSTGSLSFSSAPDYESPTDTDSNNTYQVVVRATDVSGNTTDQTSTIAIFDNEITGSGDKDNFSINKGQGGTTYINGGDGDDTAQVNGEIKDYKIESGSVILTDLRSGTNDGVIYLKNIEYIQFADQLVEESKVDVIKTYTGNFSDYKFYNKGNGKYEIKTDSGYDDITGYPLLRFIGEEETSAFRDVSAIVDIKGTFDQVTGLNTDSGRMFRLYNASFKRLPDADGLEYWINQFSSGANSIRVVASSFLGSAEFKQRYGEDVTDSTYVNTLYKNVLGRDADTSGLNYWLGQLNSGAETRYEVLLGFAESAENKALFTEMTGFG